MENTVNNNVDNGRIDVSNKLPPQEKPKTRLALEVDQIVSMIGPVALAGGCFPGLVIVIGWVCFLVVGIVRVVIDAGPFSADLLGGAIGSFMAVFVGIVLGFGAGSLYAGVAAMIAASLVVCFHWSTNGKLHPRWLAQLVGGMTGFWSVAAIGCASRDWDLPIIVMTTMFATFAMVVGQRGAAIGYRKMHGKYIREAGTTDFQFGIRDMLIGTTWIAAFVALFVAIPRVSFVYLACWVVLQPVTFVIGESIRRYRVRRGQFGPKPI